jgi:hypothetical protein
LSSQFAHLRSQASDLGTPSEAARAVGISTKTLLRWQKEPEFDDAFRAAKRAAFGQSIARLHHLSSSAVSTLGKVMLDSATPPATAD